jgi:hypothetical protein
MGRPRLKLEELVLEFGLDLDSIVGCLPSKIGGKREDAKGVKPDWILPGGGTKKL